MHYFTKEFFTDNCTDACSDGLETWFPNDETKYPANYQLIRAWFEQYGSGYICRGLGLDPNLDARTVMDHIEKNGLEKTTPVVPVEHGDIISSGSFTNNYLVLNKATVRQQLNTHTDDLNSVMLYCFGGNSGGIFYNVEKTAKFLRDATQRTITFTNKEQEN